MTMRRGIVTETFFIYKIGLVSLLLFAFSLKTHIAGTCQRCLCAINQKLAEFELPEAVLEY